MKSVLISIRPEWIQKIFSGEKTIEVRKTFPKLPPPFRCFIYCTKPRYDHEDILMTMTGPHSYYWGGGKVVAEFICDNVKEFSREFLDDWNLDAELMEKGCISAEEVMGYALGHHIYGWHISELKVYDKPKPLSDFKRWCGDGKWATLERMKRAPQSWCYVDGGLIG